MLAKQILSEILRFYLYKLDNDLCTMEEIESATRALEEDMDIHGTIQDFAKFYQVSEGNVRTTINRKMFGSPKRRVYYRFIEFMKAAPERWRKKDGFHE